MRILGIESSCDETAAAVVEDGRRLLSNVVNSQIDIHTEYGGVVPEIAARSHLEVVNPVINKALSDANCTWDDIDAVAVTYAPGLIGSLLVGTLAARTLAVIHHKPLYAIHHVEAHVYANFITEYGIKDSENRTITNESSRAIKLSETSATRVSPTAYARETRREAVSDDFDSENARPTPLTLPKEQPKFPLLALIVSGGHSQLVYFRNHGDYDLIGQTQDDAVGEAFDKVAKILGLPYPGGPSITNAANQGDPHAFVLPIAQLKCTHKGTHPGVDCKAQPSNTPSRTKQYGKGVAQVATKQSAQEVCHYYDFSFSGLKTAVLRAVQREVGKDFTFPSHELPALVNDELRHNMAASFQYTAIKTLVDKTVQAFHDLSPASVVIAGGVAANQELRRQLTASLPIPIEYAPMQLCTDNAAMIATLGYYRSQLDSEADPLDFEVQPSLSMMVNSTAKGS